MHLHGNEFRDLDSTRSPLFDAGPDPLMRGMNATEVDAAIRALEAEMADLQNRHRDLFAYAAAWAERYDAIIAAAPSELRASAERRLHRVGVRWGVSSGVRMTCQFPALKSDA